MVYLASGGFWLSLGQTIAAAAAFLLSIAFANLVSKETYGVYRYVLSIMNILSVATLTGINTALIQASARGYEGVFWKIVRAKLAWGTLGSLASFGLSGYYYLSGNSALAISFLVVGLFLPIAKAAGLYISILYGRKDFRRSTLYDSIVTVGSALAVGVTIFQTENIFAILLAYFASEIILQSIFTLHLFRRVPLNTNIDPSVVSYGVHLSAMEVLKTIASQIDKVLIFQFIGAIELAVYSFAVALPSQIKSFLENLKSLALPKLSHTEESDIRTYLPKKIFRLEILVLVIVVLYILLAPFVYNVFFPQYRESILYSQVYALSLLFLPRTFLSTALVAKMKKEELYAIRIVSPILRIAILFLALWLWGLWGMIVGKIASDAVLFVFYRHYFRKAFRAGVSLGPVGEFGSGEQAASRIDKEDMGENNNK